MDIKETKKSLQTLITRLQDAEMGFLEIAKATDLPEVKAMVQRNAQEREYMRKALSFHLEDLGVNPDLGTSFASGVHRAWIDVKVNGWGDSFVQIVDEIDTGATVLIDEYQIVLMQTEMNSTLRMLLTKQQQMLILQLNQLRQYRDTVLEIKN